ncbi:MAG: hypothetical protein ACREH8_11340 [Opitutaceae bacterium]
MKNGRNIRPPPRSVALPATVGFHDGMRLLFLLCGVTTMAFAATPPELAKALETFRSDPPRAWSFSQTTTASGKSTVEHYDAAKPGFDRWSLVRRDGRTPTAGELKDYAEARSRRSRTGTAPGLVEQFVFDALEMIGETPERVTYRCPLRPGESRDKTALFLRATLVVHKPTHTIESVELANVEPFNPTFGVKIATLKTLMTYSHPADTLPSLPQKVSTSVRGTAFLFKSLDADMTVTYSNYVKVGR